MALAIWMWLTKVYRLWRRSRYSIFDARDYRGANEAVAAASAAGGGTVFFPKGYVFTETIEVLPHVHLWFGGYRPTFKWSEFLKGGK